MYFVMESRAGDRDPVRIGSYPDIPAASIADMVFWIAGRHIRRPLPDPLRFEIDPNYGDVMPDLFEPQIPLFSDRLVSALAAAGVDNLELFPAEIRDPRDGTVHTDYKAVNIIGLISCADMEQSEYDRSHPARIIAVPFDKLVVDEDRVGDLLLFRLAESAATILVHERVKNALEPQGFTMLEFISLDEWSN